jgi:hypothetical protein
VLSRHPDGVFDLSELVSVERTTEKDFMLHMPMEKSVRLVAQVVRHTTLKNFCCSDFER